LPRIYQRTICIQTFNQVVFHGSPLKQQATTTGTIVTTPPILFQSPFGVNLIGRVKSFLWNNDSITTTGYRGFSGRDIYSIHVYYRDGGDFINSARYINIHQKLMK